MNAKPYQFFLNLPFGETMAEQHSHTADFESRYKFNNLSQLDKVGSKELQDEFGLDWYQMDERMYDPAICRWTSQDPVVQPSWSMYNAHHSNPILFADPGGAMPGYYGVISVTAEEGYTVTYYGEETQYANSVGDAGMGASNAAGLGGDGEGTDDEWIQFSTGETVKVGDKGGNNVDYITRVNEDGSITNITQAGGKINNEEGKEFTIEISATPSVGFQAGITTPYGKIEAGVATTEGNTYYANTDNGGSTGVRETDLKLHNFAKVNIGINNLVSAGGEVDVVMNPNQNPDDVGQMIVGEGYDHTDYSFSIGPKTSHGNNQQSFDIAKPKLSTSGTIGNEFIGLNTSIGAKLILGIEIGIKIGWK